MKKVLFAAAVILAVVLSYSFGRHTASTHKNEQSARRILYYVDPMHPAFKSDKPGIAPDCGMQLEPVYEDQVGKSETAESKSASSPRLVTLDLEKQQLIGLRFDTVTRGSGHSTVRVLGRVSAEDTRVYRIASAVQGWVQDTSGDSVATFVKKDQRLATFYSPDFVTFENGYIAATERGTSEMKEFARSVKYSADRLRALGMSEGQIKEIGESRQIPSSVYVVSPTDGFITVRNISPGMRFDRQTEFYQIADLSKVWIIAEIFENEARYFRPGMEARVSIPGQERTLHARVSESLPQVDPATRTVQLRLEASNPGFIFRPNMFVDVEMPVTGSGALTVGADAVVDSGLKQRVFVDHGNGEFEAREVQVGRRFNDRVEVLKGLGEGERVVAAGTFLLDSESRLRNIVATQVTKTAEASDDHHEVVKANSASSPDARDPRCGMQISKQEAEEKGNILEYKGSKFFFCSRSCRDEFASDPEKYVPARYASAK